MSLPDLHEPLTLLEQKDFDRAVEVLERKVTALPAHLGAQVLLAYAYEGQQRWEQALHAWEEVHVLLPNSPLADAGKTRVLRRMDDFEDAPREAVGVPPAAVPSSAASPAEEEPPSASGAEEETAEAPPDEQADEPESPPEDESAEEETPDGLAQLRQQAEREARQGGARGGLADEAPDLPPEEEAPPSTPEEQVEQLEDTGDDDALDRLIDKLESARIDPDPEAESDPAEPPPPDPDDGESEEVVSETLARIHEAQEDFDTAAHIYEQLAEQEPDRAEEFQDKAAELRAKADDPDAEA